MAEKPSDEQVASLTEAASAQYALKNYEAAAELYSRATEMQSELKGEMSAENADLLYLYGRCLYKVGVGKNDVLGATVKKEEKAKKSKTTNGEGSSSKAAQKDAEVAIEAALKAKDGEEEPKPAEQPLFQFTGDENWDTDSDEDAAEGEGNAEDDDEDDMSNAYEILDMARVILQKKLEAHAGLPEKSKDVEDKGKGKAKAVEVYPGDVSDPVVRATKEQLAEILDLQADISLESERFHDAVPDNQATLALRKEFLPEESSLIAESHYKLSLSLEFASVTAVRDAQNDPQNGEGIASEAEPPQIDEEMRKEAASHMESAIASCKLRIKKEEHELSSFTGSEKEKKEKNIKEVKEILEEMELRLLDLKASPIEIPSIVGPAGATDPNPLGGILGSILGESASQQKARIDEATKAANDLSGLVRKKKPTTDASPAESSGKGKRKLESNDEDSDSKKAKVEDADGA